MSLDQKLFQWVKTTIAPAFTDPTRVVRRDFPQSIGSIAPPRAVYIPFNESTRDIGSGAKEHAGTLTIRIDAERAIAFGTGDTPEASGTLHDLIDVIDALIDDAVPTLAGYSAVKLTKIVARDGDGTVDHAARTLRYTLKAYTGLSGVPMSGGEASLAITGYDGVVESWIVNDRSPLNADMTSTDDDHPQYELGDATALGTIRFIPLETDMPLPALGSTACVFTYHDAASWSDTIKIHDRRWAVRPGTNEVIGLDLSFVIDNDASPFFTGVIP